MADLTLPRRAAAVCALAAVLLLALLASPPAKAADPLAGSGMWIWNIPKSSLGDPVAIGTKAKQAGLSYVIVKAANGAARWPGFTAPFITALHAQGLRVCGYQRVMSTRTAAQASVFASQIQLGADCAVIDAESELEGRYAGARAYMSTLRAALGSTFPIALTSFPWIGYHPTFPYSVFLAPGAAQYDVPQIYWKDIGVSVDKAFANTYPANSLYGRPIRPVGQLYGKPATADVLKFRTLAQQYGSTGLSWWDWEEAAPSGWAAIGRPLVIPDLPAVVTPPTLAVGARSDLVRWARMRLKTRRMAISTASPLFDTAMRSVVLAYQLAHQLPPTGAVDPATWALLKPVYKTPLR